MVGTGSDRKQGFTYKLFCQILCHFLLWFPDLSFVLTAVKSLDSWTTTANFSQAVLYRKPKYYYKNNPLPSMWPDRPASFQSLSFCLICLILSLSYLSGPATPSSRSLLPTSSSLHSPSISIHNAWRVSHTITTYYRCPYSPQPAQQAAALRKGKKKKSLFSVERASLRRKLNQPTKYTTIIQPKPRNKKLSETSSFHHKEQFSQSPTGRHICDAGISVPSLPACQPLQNVSIFRAWAAGSSQQHFPFPHNPHDSGIRAETTPTLNPGAPPTEGLGQGLEMQS